MSLGRATLHNRHAVWALALAATVFGMMAYAALPLELFPDTAPPVVNVLTRQPGASAEDVARDLGRPLEEELASLEGVARVRTSSQDGLSVVSIELQYDRDLDLAAVDVQNALSRIRSRLPEGLEEPRILKLSTSDRPILSIGLAAGDLREARRLAEDEVAPRLQRVSGVAAVDVFGGAVDSVLVEVEPRRLEAYRIPFQRIVDTVRAHNSALPAGSVRTETRSATLRMEARARSVADLAAIPLVAADGSRLLLGELATVGRGSLDDDARFAIDGNRGIAVQVFKTDRANTVEVVDRVLAEIDALRLESPDVTFILGEESASFTRTSVGNLLDNVWQALGLAAVIIFLFIGRLRSSLVVALAMPLSFGMAFALMHLSGIALNLVTLSAVILAVGMVVDATVVVVENIERRRDADGLSPADAAIAGTDEVRLPVLAGAATTAVVLVPLMFLRGFVGKTFGPLAQTLLYAFLSSVAVALVLVPVLSTFTAGGGRLDRFGARATAPFRWIMDRLREIYVALLRRALRRRAMVLVAAVVLFAIGVGAIRQRGMDVLPRMDGGTFFVSLETPSGSSLEETERVVREVEAVLSQESEIVLIQSQVGFEAGMRSLGTIGVQGPTQAMITVTLTPRTERSESIWEIQERVRQGVARVPGIRTSTVRELGNTAKSTTAAPIVLRLSGDDPLVLDALGAEALDRLTAVPGLVEPTRSWRLDQERFEVEVDPLRAGQLGLSPAAVARQMQLGSVGAAAGSYYADESTTVPIVVRYRRPTAGDVRSLLDYPVLPADGSDGVTLRQVASARPVTGPGLLTSESFSSTLEISAFVRDRALSFVKADVEVALTEMALPLGYTVDLVGETADLAEARSQLGGALLLSLLAVYLLLVAQLRSFLHPLTILVSVPLSLSGVGAALWLTDKAVSMPVMVALVLLVGTVVNNAILLLDFIRTARVRGASREQALIGAVSTRFRPIMMTSLSTIGGMIPLAAEWALGAERFSPLAIAVIGGMTASTFLTMLVIPVLYDVLDAAGERARRGGVAPVPAPSPVEVTGSIIE